MPKLAANISLLFNDRPFPDRYKAAADAGFKAVECLFPYDHPVEDLKACLTDNGLRQVLFNAPPGDWEKGERGLAALPDRVVDFQQGFETALRYADGLGTAQIHIMAGIVYDLAERARYEATLLQNLSWAASLASDQGVTILLEPLNPADMPGYFYSRTQDAIDIIDAIGMDNIKLQLDLYHRQRVEGALTDAIERHFNHIGHIQIAGVPDRHEPIPSEIDPAFLFERLDSLGYTGWIGCEYHPRGDTIDGLKWAKDWLQVS